MTIIPCSKNKKLEAEIEQYAEALKTEAYKIGAHGLSEKDFYEGGLFRGAIERIRGQYSASMGSKREFAKHILNYMQDQKFIKNWDSAGGKNRFDYTVTLNSGKIAVVELKGALDGNNTNIFERPSHANEFILWSVATNTGGDPGKNAWSGIHTRLSAEIIEKKKQVDGLIIWDWACGTGKRPCPKVLEHPERQTIVGPYNLTPPCIYLFPNSVPTVRNNPSPEPHKLEEVEILQAFHRCFKGEDRELNYVRFTAANKGADIVRSTSVVREGIAQKTSKETPIRRQ